MLISGARPARRRHHPCRGARMVDLSRDLTLLSEKRMPEDAVARRRGAAPAARGSPRRPEAKRARPLPSRRRARAIRATCAASRRAATLTDARPGLAYRARKSPTVRRGAPSPCPSGRSPSTAAPVSTLTELPPRRSRVEITGCRSRSSEECRTARRRAQHQSRDDQRVLAAQMAAPEGQEVLRPSRP